MKTVAFFRFFPAIGQEGFEWIERLNQALPQFGKANKVLRQSEILPH